MPSLHHAGFNGFTLLEALLVLALLGILMALAAPSVTDLRHKHQMQSHGERLLGSLVLARSEAVRRQQRVTLCVRGAADQCATEGSWGQGWMVFVDANDNAVREAHEAVLQLQEGVPDFLKLQGNSTVNRYVSYGLEGRSQTSTGAFQAGTLTLCKPGQAAIWRVVINAVGKPRLERAEMPVNAEC